MDVCWPVTIGEKTNPIGTHTFIPILISMTRQHGALSATLVVWDVQTGVIVGTVDLVPSGRIVFHGDQRTITLISDSLFYTYDALNGTYLYKGEVTLWSSQLGTHWSHGDTLWFVASPRAVGEPVVNIYELKPTLSHPVNIISSFPVPPYEGEFSFSPVSFHGSFFNGAKLVILDVRDSKLLLHTTVGRWASRSSPGQFSHDGTLFACGISMHEIRIWQNTPTGYVFWSSLKPQLQLRGFSWSPTSTLILCWCQGGILVLHPGNNLGSLSPNRDNPKSPQRDHVVACSADQTYIAMARKEDSVVMVLNCCSGATQQFINMDMQIQEIKIVNNTVFVMDTRKLVSWDLKVGGAVDGAHGVEGVISDETLVIDAYAEHLTLSYDCSQIAFFSAGRVFLYDVKTQEILKSFKQEARPFDIQFSPNGHQLWFPTASSIYYSRNQLLKLDMVEDWGSVEVIGEVLVDEWAWVNLFSPHGFHVEMGSGWVVGPRDSKIFWLPPNWRVNYGREVKWEGDYLALVAGHNLTPIIIEFQL